MIDPQQPAADIEGPIVHQVREYETIDIPISGLMEDGELQLDPAIVGRGYFDVRLKKRTLALQAGGWVGLIPLSDRVVLDVRPRVPISNIARVLRVANHAPTLLETAPRHYAHEFEELPSLREVYARALIEALAPIEARGLLRSYSRREEPTSHPRGRLLLADHSTQLAASGLSTRVGAAWYERTPDVAANRCIKFAIWFLAQRLSAEQRPSKGVRQLVRQLNRAYRLFDGVVLERGVPFGFLGDSLVSKRDPLPTTRLYYRDALAISLLVVQNLALVLDQPGTETRMRPLVLDMDAAFESYVRTILQEAPVGNVTVLDGNGTGKKPLFDSQPSEAAQPDIVVRSEGGDAMLVADVKYKPAANRPPREDLNQVITYAASYRAPVAVVVQPRSKNSDQLHLQKLGTIDSLAVYQYVVDLGADDLAYEEEQLAAAVLGLAAQADSALSLVA